MILCKHISKNYPFNTGDIIRGNESSNSEYVYTSKKAGFVEKVVSLNFRRYGNRDKLDSIDVKILQSIFSDKIGEVYEVSPEFFELVE